MLTNNDERLNVCLLLLQHTVSVWHSIMWSGPRGVLLVFKSCHRGHGSQQPKGRCLSVRTVYAPHVQRTPSAKSPGGWQTTVTSPRQRGRDPQRPQLDTQHTRKHGNSSFILCHAPKTLSQLTCVSGCEFPWSLFFICHVINKEWVSRVNVEHEQSYRGTKDSSQHLLSAMVSKLMERTMFKVTHASRRQFYIFILKCQRVHIPSFKSTVCWGRSWV